MDNQLANIQNNMGLLALVFIASVWQLFWKGVALWKASNQKQRNWFLVLFVLIPLNDLGIVELIYLIRFSKKRLTIVEVRSWFKKS